jgi:proteasome lid subunit RPN8/RPN11
MLTISKDLLDKINAHARKGYPREVCGILFGKESDFRQVIDVRPVRNLEELVNDRFRMDPKDIMKAENDAEAKKLLVLGYYHSHPDHPAIASQFDKDRAWPWYSYLIVSVTSVGVNNFKSWRLQETEMIEEIVKITD